MGARPGTCARGRTAASAALARRVIPAQEFITGQVRGSLLILFGSVGFVLLIACANVANLQLARADVRRREVAVRTALGAGRGQIVAQLLTESVLLSIAGAIAGLAVAWAGLQIVITLRPANLPRLDETSLDGTVLVFTALLAIVTGILFGLLPALQLSRPDVTGVLKDGGRIGTAGRSRQLARRGLVVLQLASSVVLALAAGLLIRSLIELNRIDLGFNPANVLTAQLQVPATDYPQPADVVRFHRQAIERIAQIPGVRAVGLGARAAAGANDRRLVDQDRGPSIRARRKSERRFPGGDARLLRGDGTEAGSRPLPDRRRSRGRDAGRGNQRDDGRALLAQRGRDRPSVHDGHRRQAVAHHRRRHRQPCVTTRSSRSRARRCTSRTRNCPRTFAPRRAA